MKSFNIEIIREETIRQIESLERSLGEDFLKALRNPKIIEVMLNSNGDLWVDELSVGMSKIGSISMYNSRIALNTIATMLGQTLSKENPIIEGEFPLDRSRFAGQIAPIVSAPTFALRKKASLVFTLEDYLEKGVITSKQVDLIKKAIADHKNIVIVGGTSSGKTTLVNACIDHMSKIAKNERIVIIEDTGEIQCKAENSILYHTSKEVSMSDLLKTTLRMRPDRIIIGEVRDKAALDLLDAWSTGHAGGISTVHANNASQALDRIEGLVTRHEYAPKDIKSVICNAINIIVNIRKVGSERKVEEIIELDGFDQIKNSYVFKYI